MVEIFELRKLDSLQKVMQLYVQTYGAHARSMSQRIGHVRIVASMIDSVKSSYHGVTVLVRP